MPSGGVAHTLLGESLNILPVVPLFRWTQVGPGRSFSGRPGGQKVRSSKVLWTRSLTGALALLVGLMLTAPPAFAAEPQTNQTQARPHAQQTLTAAATAKLADLDVAEAVVAAPQESESSADTAKSFFKTPKGVAALVLFVAGVSYTFYSKSHDRVHSPIR